MLRGQLKTLPTYLGKQGSQDSEIRLKMTEVSISKWKKKNTDTAWNSCSQPSLH